jgi:hypothetical protein
MRPITDSSFACSPARATRQALTEPNNPLGSHPVTDGSASQPSTYVCHLHAQVDFSRAP